jgi:hypothetical protein
MSDSTTWGGMDVHKENIVTVSFGDRHDPLGEAEHGQGQVAAGWANRGAWEGERRPLAMMARILIREAMTARKKSKKRP